MGYHLHEKLIEKLEDFKKNDLSAYKEEKKKNSHITGNGGIVVWMRGHHE